MRNQVPFRCYGDESFTVIHACYVLTEEYRKLLMDLGKAHQLSENEMLVLVHLDLYPNACTQKKLQETQLQLSVSSICRMVESLRKKGYLTTQLDENDRRSWIIHLEEEGRALAQEFRQCLQQRMGNAFQEIPGFDFQGFAATMSQAAALVRRNVVSA